MIRPCVRAGVSFVAAPARQQAAAADERDPLNRQLRSRRQFVPRLLRVCRPAARRKMRPNARVADLPSSTMGRPETFFVVLGGRGVWARRSSALFHAIPAAGCRVHRLAPDIHGMASLFGRRDTPAIESPRPNANRRPATASAGANPASMLPVRERRRAECPRTGEIRVVGQRLWRQCRKLTLTPGKLDADRRDVLPEAGFLPSKRLNTRAQKIYCRSSSMKGNCHD